MPRVRWKLTKNAITDEPKVDEWGSEECSRFGQPVVPLLALLAADPCNELVKIAPGVYRGPKVP